MHIQNLSEPVVFIISSSTTFKLLHFKWTIVRHSEHSIKCLQLTDLLHVLQIAFADIRPDKSIKERERKNVMTKLMKALLPLNLLIPNAITFIIIETVRISKRSKLNSFFPQKSCRRPITTAGIYKNWLVILIKSSNKNRMSIKVIK